MITSNAGSSAVFGQGDHIVVGPSSSRETRDKPATSPVSRRISLQRTKSLSLIHQNITSIRHLQDLVHMTSLRSLNLHMNRITALENGVLEPLHLLEQLELSGNDIAGVVPQDALRGLGRLRRLNLSSNRITAFHPKCFAPLHCLSWVSLAFNELQDVQVFRSLPPSARLSVVNLCGNCLRQLSDVEHALALQKGSLTSLRLRAPLYAGTIHCEESASPEQQRSASGPSGGGAAPSYVSPPAVRENYFVLNPPAEKDGKAGGLKAKQTTRSPPRSAAAVVAPLLHDNANDGGCCWYMSRLMSYFPALRVLDDAVVAVDPLRQIVRSPSLLENADEEGESGRNKERERNRRAMSSTSHSYMSEDRTAHSAEWDLSRKSSFSPSRSRPPPSRELLLQRSSSSLSPPPTPVKVPRHRHRPRKPHVVDTTTASRPQKPVSLRHAKGAERKPKEETPASQRSRTKEKGTQAALPLPPSPPSAAPAAEAEGEPAAASPPHSTTPRTDGLNMSIMGDDSAADSSGSALSSTTVAGGGGDEHRTARLSPPMGNNTELSPSSEPKNTTSVAREVSPGNYPPALPWREKRVAARTQPIQELKALQHHVIELKEALEIHEAREAVLRMQITQQLEQEQLQRAEVQRQSLELHEMKCMLDKLQASTGAQISALKEEVQRRGQEVVLARKHAAADLKRHTDRLEADAAKRLEEATQTSQRFVSELKQKHQREQGALQEALQRCESHAARLQQEAQGRDGWWHECWRRREQQTSLQLSEWEGRARLLDQRYFSLLGGLTHAPAHSDGTQPIFPWVRDFYRLAAKAAGKREKEWSEHCQRSVQKTEEGWQARQQQWERERRALESRLDAARESTEEQMRIVHEELAVARQQRRATAEVGSQTDVEAVEEVTVIEETMEESHHVREEAPLVQHVNARLQSVCDAVVDTQLALHKENERLLRRVEEVEHLLAQKMEQIEALQGTEGSLRTEVDTLAMDREALTREVRNLQEDLRRKGDAAAQLEEEAMEKIQEKRQRIAELEEEVDLLKARAEEATSLSIQCRDELNAKTAAWNRLEEALRSDSGGGSADRAVPLHHRAESLQRELHAAHARLQRYEADQVKLLEAMRIARDQLVLTVQAKEKLLVERGEHTRRLQTQEAELQQLRERLRHLDRAAKEKQVATLEALTQMIRSDIVVPSDAAGT